MPNLIAPLIHAPYYCIVVFCHISSMPPQSHICNNNNNNNNNDIDNDDNNDNNNNDDDNNTPMFCIAAIFVKYCSTTIRWLL